MKNNLTLKPQHLILQRNKIADGPEHDRHYFMVDTKIEIEICLKADNNFDYWIEKLLKC